ncbi:electron transfer flavoprotein subunit alpha/FixB family protein [candidate division TA06 bacterium]|uniref:Electron transfer flavoprotein subunit alpha/FixB family protein n=1 Tax=candidate division TA06 bacterium TaxID=2250710 RepID=A0A523XK74_UNCT6|nr:MAG: electron transfer flavoprotein subunit alpha/FixB family protein [candidate division TA06 bacterium]
MGHVLVIAEHSNGKVRSASYEVLGVAEKLAEKTSGSVSAMLVGDKLQGLDKLLASYGAHKVYLVENSHLGVYSTEGHCAAVCKVIEEAKPEMVLLAASSRGKDLSPRVAARLGVGVASDCTDVSYENGLVVTRPVYAGKIISKVKVSGEKPYMATVRPKIFPAPQKDESATAEVIKVDVTVDPSTIRARVKEFLKPETEFPDVTEADIIVSGGRGLKDGSKFEILEELAKLLGGSVGASRAAVDAEWRDHADQVGQTGKVVNPNLYVACGISGAIQHLVGMRTSKCIVAINKDAEAPIFKVADYGIVGDLFEVVPLLKEELEKQCR